MVQTERELARKPHVSIPCCCLESRLQCDSLKRRCSALVDRELAGQLCMSQYLIIILKDCTVTDLKNSCLVQVEKDLSGLPCVFQYLAPSSIP